MGNSRAVRVRFEGGLGLPDARVDGQVSPPSPILQPIEPMSARSRNRASDRTLFGVTRGLAPFTRGDAKLPIHWMGNSTRGAPGGAWRSVFGHIRTPYEGFDVAPRASGQSVRFGEFVDTEVGPIGIQRVETESSIWFVSAERHQRLPEEERPRAPEVCIDGRLADARGHDLRRCWWREHGDGETQLRLLPVLGPETGVGVVRGVVGLRKLGAGRLTGDARRRPGSAIRPAPLMIDIARLSSAAFV